MTQLLPTEKSDVNPLPELTEELNVSEGEEVYCFILFFFLSSPS